MLRGAALPASGSDITPNHKRPTLSQTPSLKRNCFASKGAGLSGRSEPEENASRNIPVRRAITAPVLSAISANAPICEGISHESDWPEERLERCNAGFFTSIQYRQRFASAQVGDSPQMARAFIATLMSMMFLDKNRPMTMCHLTVLLNCKNCHSNGPCDIRRCKAIVVDAARCFPCVLSRELKAMSVMMDFLSSCGNDQHAT